MTPAWRLAFGSLGIATALTAASLGFVLTDDEPAASKVESKSDAILIARLPIQAGARVAQSDLEWRNVPVRDGFADAILRSRQIDSEIVGSIAQRNMIAGEIIRKGSVIAQPKRRTVAASLNPGWRAVTIKADAAPATGLLKPNDRVDLLLGGREAGEPSGPMAAPLAALQSTNAGQQMLPQQSLINVRVIAINGAVATEASAKDDEPDQSVVSSISFEVLPVHVRSIIAAADTGQLVIALRSPLESTASPASTTGMKSTRPVKPRRKARRPDQNSANSYAGPSTAQAVLVIRGGGSTSGK